MGCRCDCMGCTCGCMECRCSHKMVEIGGQGAMALLKFKASP